MMTNPLIVSWLAMCAVLQCETASFAMRNDLFRRAERPLLRGKTSMGS